MFATRATPSFRVLDAGTSGMKVMPALRGCTSLILVDACSTGGVPGTFSEVPADVVASQRGPDVLLHGFRWQHAVYAGRGLYGAAFPTDITVLLIETGSLRSGRNLSPAVTKAVSQVITRIEQLIAERSV